MGAPFRSAMETSTRHRTGASRSTIHRICITHCDVSSGPRPNGFAVGCNVDDFALTPAERALFRALHERGVRFLVVGLSAAVLEGAPIATQDINVWLERLDERVALAASDAHAFWVSGFGVQPPTFGGQAWNASMSCSPRMDWQTSTPSMRRRSC